MSYTANLWVPAIFGVVLGIAIIAIGASWLAHSIAVTNFTPGGRVCSPAAAARVPCSRIYQRVLAPVCLCVCIRVRIRVLVRACGRVRMCACVWLWVLLLLLWVLLLWWLWWTVVDAGLCKTMSSATHRGSKGSTNVVFDVMVFRYSGTLAREAQ
jgi:hypothetical protein